MMKPTFPGTDRPKTFDEMTAAERVTFARDCFGTQFANLKSGWPVDERAVELADRIADADGDETLRVQRDSFRGFRRVKEGDLMVLRQKLTDAEREVALLRQGQ